MANFSAPLIIPAICAATSGSGQHGVMSGTSSKEDSQGSILAAGSSWLLSGSVLAFGGGLPSLLLASEWTQVQRDFVV